jgi:hypothetical protein
VLFLECGDLDCCVFAEDGGGSGHRKGRVALASGLALKRLGGLLRPMFLIRLIQSYEPGGYRGSLTASGQRFLQRQRVDRLMVLFFFSGDGEGLVCLVVAAMVVCSSTIVCILLVLCYLYAYQLCIVMFMNTSNVCLWAYILKKIRPLGYPLNIFSSKIIYFFHD